MIAYRRSYSTETVLMVGILGNGCLGYGLKLLLKRYMEKRYQDWRGQIEHDYEEWKQRESLSFKRLNKVGMVCALAAVWYLYDLVCGDGTWGGLSRGWYHNFSTGYVMLMTVLLQFMLASRAVGSFWRGEMDGVMARMDERLQARLKEALEIERKSLEKVSRSDQLRVDLITNVSHDLKTPLTSIVGYVELIKKEELSDVVRDYIDVISARTEKLKEMINSLFSLAKASSGNVKLHKENFEVNRLIEQIFADMDDRVKESDLKFVVKLTEEDTKIYSDNTYFYRICQNLIENVLKYSAKGTRAFVRTYLKGEPEGEDERRICIEITNTAGYFMDFTKEDIVERFARGDKERTSEGNGLGLAIVSTYAKALGGEFDIRIDCDQFKACLEFEL
ncbi:sensor histidine kinase [Lachnospiraceae bacterium WCA-9-b2]|uniref:histidine kinase n=2 Tax=Sporofaciens musculi TaxID=2681861 RepID=A0A7X3SI86_9FIRM|nr:sensor histidine kinase [Sporofaciens musculi]